MEITDELEVAALTAALADANEARANVTHIARQLAEWTKKRDECVARLERLTARIATGKDGIADAATAKASASRRADGSIKVEVEDAAVESVAADQDEEKQ